MSRGSFASVIRFSLWGENDEQALRDHTTHHSSVISNSQKEFPHFESRPSFPCRCKYWTSSVEVANPFTKPSYQKRPHPLFVLPWSWSSSSLCSQMVHQLYSDHLTSQTRSEPRSHSFPCLKPVSNQFWDPQKTIPSLGPRSPFLDGVEDADWTCLRLTALDRGGKLRAKTFQNSWCCPWRECLLCSYAYYKVTSDARNCIRAASWVGWGTARSNKGSEQ